MKNKLIVVQFEKSNPNTNRLIDDSMAKCKHVSGRTDGWSHAAREALVGDGHGIEQWE